MRHELDLNPSPFLKIESGKKNIELRLNDEKIQLIRIGDEIEFINTEDTEKRLLTMVLAIHRYPSVEELYQFLPLLRCGYTEKNILAAKASDMDVYYSRDEQIQYDVVGIEISIIN
jgi:ASC-1-like (ASCH) protein